MNISDSVLNRLKNRIGSYFSTLNPTILNSKDIDSNLANSYTITSVVSNADGTIVAIGIPFTPNRVGVVFVYRLDVDGWVLEATLTSGLDGINDDFGRNLAITEFGNRLIVSSVRSLKHKDIDKGQVVVYVRSEDGTWTVETTLTSMTGVNDTHFGHSLAIDGWGDVIVVGSYAESTKTTEKSGVVYVYNRNINKWSVTASIVPKDVVSGSVFGYSVAIDGPGTRIAVGCTYAENSNTTNKKRQDKYYSGINGAIYLFDRITEYTWNQIYKFSENDDNVSLIGSKLCMNYAGTVIATSGIRTIAGEHEGIVLVYQDCIKGWESSEPINSSYYLCEDNFGNSIGLSSMGDRLVISSGLDSKESFSIYSNDSVDWNLDKTVLINPNGNNSRLMTQTICINGNADKIFANYKCFDLK